MKIYKFYYRSWKGMLEQIEYDVEEKPKTYTFLSGGWKSCISKREIGTVTGHAGDTVYLLSDNKKEAAKLLIEKKKTFLKMENDRHLEEVSEIETAIRFLEGI